MLNMKNKVLILVLLITFNIPLISYSQAINGIVEYSLKISENDFKNEVLSNPDVDPIMRAFIESKLKKTLEKKYVLKFCNNLSVYEENEIVEKDEVNSNNTSWSPTGLNLKTYKDTKTINKIILKDLMGKHFFVLYPLENFNWFTLNDTKYICNYYCSSIQLKIEPTPESITEYEKELSTFENNQTNFIKPIKPISEIFTVWYTKEIPVNHGPDKYWGLDGLILEVSGEKFSIVADKVFIDKDLKIKYPRSSKIISSKEFDDIVLLKQNEMKNK